MAALTCTRWRDVGLDEALQSEYDFVCLPEREMTVVRKGEKRERTEKNQQYHQRVSSSFHAQNHTESARSPSLSLSLSFSFLCRFVVVVAVIVLLCFFFKPFFAAFFRELLVPDSVVPKKESVSESTKVGRNAN